MRQPNGTLLIFDPDAPLLERDTITCGHCQRIVVVKPGTGATVYLIPVGVGQWREEMGAFCRVCMRPVCLHCHDVGTCRPIERWLTEQERCG
jgi:hypothetical protein